jgi:hypothetical protein
MMRIVKTSPGSRLSRMQEFADANGVRRGGAAARRRIFDSASVLGR